MQEKNREELEKERDSIVEQIQSTEATKFKQESLLLELNESLSKIEEAIEDLNRPKNSILKAFSKMGSKASNVIKNVQLSLMSEEELKKEYLIYTRIRDNLEEESVSFETFKKTPENYIEVPKNKESTLKKVETDFKEGLSKTTTFINETLGNGEKITKDLSEKAQPEIAKLQKNIKELSEKAQPQMEELGVKVKIGLSTLVGKLKDIKEQYSEALKQVNEEEEAASKHNSTVAKTTEAKQEMSKQSHSPKSNEIGEEVEPKKAVKRVVRKKPAVSKPKATKTVLPDEEASTDEPVKRTRKPRM